MASELLILFSFLEPGDISELMLRRGCLSNKIWCADGEISKIDPLNAGLDPELVNLLDEEMQFDHAIEQLLALLWFNAIALWLERKGSRFTLSFSIVHVTGYPLEHGKNGKSKLFY